MPNAGGARGEEAPDTKAHELPDPMYHSSSNTITHTHTHTHNKNRFRQQNINHFAKNYIRQINEELISPMYSSRGTGGDVDGCRRTALARGAGGGGGLLLRYLRRRLAHGVHEVDVLCAEDAWQHLEADGHEDGDEHGEERGDEGEEGDDEYAQEDEELHEGESSHDAHRHAAEEGQPARVELGVVREEEDEAREEGVAWSRPGVRVTGCCGLVTGQG